MRKVYTNKQVVVQVLNNKKLIFHSCKIDKTENKIQPKNAIMTRWRSFKTFVVCEISIFLFSAKNHDLTSKLIL